MHTSTAKPVGLVADIGGTNARFATCYSDRTARQERVLPCANFPGPIEAIKAYLKSIKLSVTLEAMAIAIASPITGDIITMTNHPWRFSIQEIRQALGLHYLRIINDFAAVAACIPYLTDKHYIQVGRGQLTINAPIGVLGAGTGLGVAFLIPSEGGHWHIVPTEGGHITIPVSNDVESSVIEILRRRFGHVSAERILSGPGLVNLYSALAIINKKRTKAFKPSTVVEYGLSGIDSLCVEALHIFLSMFGSTVGNFSLSADTRGGVYLAGGIIPRLTTMLSASPFRDRFENKGRFYNYNTQIPTYIITHPYPAFLGLCNILCEQQI